MTFFVIREYLHLKTKAILRKIVFQIKKKSVKRYYIFFLRFNSCSLFLWTQGCDDVMTDCSWGFSTWLRTAFIVEGSLITRLTQRLEAYTWLDDEEL